SAFPYTTLFRSFPLRSLASSKLTRCPSERVLSPARSTADMWTNTSLPPPSGWMKPNPLVALNHFTVPVGMKSELPWPLRNGGRGARRWRDAPKARPHPLDQHRARLTVPCPLFQPSSVFSDDAFGPRGGGRDDYGRV